VAFFYCSQQQGGASVDAPYFGSCEAAKVLRALLAQISCDLDGSISKHVLNWLEHGTISPPYVGIGPDSSYRPSMTRKVSLSECVELLGEITKINDQTTFIIDALDEYLDPYTLLIRIHSTANSKSQNIHIVNIPLISEVMWTRRRSDLIAISEYGHERSQVQRPCLRFRMIRSWIYTKQGKVRIAAAVLSTNGSPASFQIPIQTQSTVTSRAHVLHNSLQTV